MKRIILFLLVFYSYSFADICSDHFGEDYIVLGEDRSEHTSLSLWGACSAKVGTSCIWDQPSPGLEVNDIDHTITGTEYSEWENDYNYTANDQAYEHWSYYKEYVTYRCGYAPECDVPNAEYSIAKETCVCKDGYVPEYDLTGGLISCKHPECPPSVYDLPLFKTVSPADISLCNFFPLSDSNFVILDSQTGCCYGQPNIEDNNTCPPNNIEINGQCYPITSSDDNKTPISHDCPMGEYWSFSANNGEGGCLPFFPDDNSTDPLPSDSVLDGTITDENGTSFNIDLGYNFDNLNQDQGVADSLVADAVKLDNVSGELNKLLNSYVLIDLPLRASGTCDTELVKTISVLGASYTVDARPWVSKFTEYIPLIRSLVIFSFIFAGVLIVLGRGGD